MKVDTIMQDDTPPNEPRQWFETVAFVTSHGHDYVGSRPPVSLA